MNFEIRDCSVNQGARALLTERQVYLQLVQQGVNYKEAARIMGVDPRTGRRWRNGRNASGGTVAALPIDMSGASPKPSATPPDDPSRYLREADRIHVADRLREGTTIRAIAVELGRSPSTISREIRRNRHPVNGHYRPHAAQVRADARRPRPKHGKITRDRELRDFIQEHLTLRWSPEQICNALRKQFPDRPQMHVTHETIYQALYNRGRGDLHRDLTRTLRTGRARRRPRRQAHKRLSRAVRNMAMISDRPAEVADRVVAGHWEGDLIIGKDHKSAIGTLVERTTRYVMLVHLPAGHNEAATRDALAETITTLPPHLRRSLTWDQGSEMAAHRTFTAITGVPVYFCHPASPWQRGSNENTNGLLRQYFPKGTDLSRYTREALDAVATELNNRPRKTLGWETPAERLATLLAA